MSTKKKSKLNNLFNQDLNVINVGLSSFADTINESGGVVKGTEWKPPARGNKEVGKQLALLMNDQIIEEANLKAYDNLLAAQPTLQRVLPAHSIIPNMGEKMILHAGPPIEWERMCGPMKGAVIGAIIYENWADNIEEARTLAGSGKIAFEPCHHHAAVGPMSGVLCPSMPVWVVKNLEHGNISFSSLNEGLGKVLRFGAYSAEVIERLRWMEKILGPAMNMALEKLDGLKLKPIMAQALHMGDEVHNRNVAASSLLFKRLTLALLETDLPRAEIASVLEFIATNDHFFLNISMAACKAMLDASHGIPCSSLVTAMTRNGVEFGIRVSGTDDMWFTAPAPLVDGLFFPGYTVDDAAPDLGDSAIAETMGVGGFAMGTSPSIVQFVGGNPQDAIAYTREMGNITLGLNSAFTLPPLNFAGTPSGIDIRKVIDTGIAPVINTGIAHRDAGVGQVGAGVTRAPLACFEQSIIELASRVDEMTIKI